MADSPNQSVAVKKKLAVVGLEWRRSRSTSPIPADWNIIKACFLLAAMYQPPVAWADNTSDDIVRDQHAAEARCRLQARLEPTWTIVLMQSRRQERQAGIMGLKTGELLEEWLHCSSAECFRICRWSIPGVSGDLKLFP